MKPSTSISALAVAVFIAGVFFLAIPPVGMILIIISFCIQKSFRNGVRSDRAARQSKVDAKREREFILACRSI